MAIAAAIHADRCDIYTDVDGVYTTDPRVVPRAQRLPKVAFEEMLELAGVGAKVLNVRSVGLAMPKGLVIGALVLLVLVVLALSWLSNRSMQPDEAVAEDSNVAAPVEAAAPAPPAAAPAATGPVVLTATDAVWIQVKDGSNTLKMGQLSPGESFEVPASAAAPVLTTGKPEALKIMVGSAQAPAVGDPGKTVAGVSLKAADLMRATGAQPAATAAQTPSAVPTASVPPASRPARRQPRPTQSTPPATAPDAADATQANSAEPAATN